MAKSIRAKCRRASRTEFRNTIGTVAHNKNQEILQEKLKVTLEKQNMKSLERISNILQTSVVDDSKMETEQIGGLAVVDAMESSAPKAAPADLKGENMIPTKMSRKRKHALAKKAKQGDKPKAERATKQRPKYFCSF